MNRIGRRGRMNSDSDTGAAAVEFALVCILLMIMIVGVVEIGRLYAAQLSVTHAAREGARLAAVNKFDLAAVQQHAAPLDPTKLVVAGPAVSTDAAGAKCVSVTVTYPFEVELLGADWLRGVTDVSLTSSSVMRAEF